ncbi:Oidioi.mRNA.OKI2018_I69.XSR.g13305.t2.cds [Oikopleura dioica]|uniref:Oidioi.mRNA.OKI2018_I69.XSR.g13305.t2.cds n=1 Tax=Oikopleura dioica TaxID=34765 RepID=A0ABN7SCL1_OIKDI|nr:Oidioi.mRNA.OKI2018_I69.XSR.g13305.t2.cds [Oikopleura dioica]
MKRLRKVFGGKKDSKNDSRRNSMAGEPKDASSLRLTDSFNTPLPKLHAAAKAGDLMKMEKELRKLGATGVNSKDDIGRTPIHIAVIYEKKEALEMLCKQQQKNLNATDSDLRTPLMYAAELGNIDAVETLIKYKCNINCKDRFESNALHYSCYAKKLSPVVEKLLENGLSPNEPNTQGDTAMHIAAKEDKADLMEILLKYDGELNKPNRAGLTPLMVAAKEGRHNVVNQLTAAGAKLNICDADENDALKLAQIAGHGGIAGHLKSKLEEEKLKQPATPAFASSSESDSEMSSTESDSGSETEEHSFSSNRFPPLPVNQVPQVSAAPPKTHPSTNVDTGKKSKQKPSGSNVDTGSWNDTTESFSEPPKKPKKRFSFSWGSSKSSSTKSIKNAETKISKDLIGQTADPPSSSVDPPSSSVDPPPRELSVDPPPPNNSKPASRKSSVKNDESEESDWKSSQEFVLPEILAKNSTGSIGDVDYAGIVAKHGLGLVDKEAEKRKNSEILEELQHRGERPKQVNTLYQAKDLEPPQPHPQTKDPFMIDFSSDEDFDADSDDQLERAISPQPPGNPPEKKTNASEDNEENKIEEESDWDDTPCSSLRQPSHDLTIAKSKEEGAMGKSLEPHSEEDESELVPLETKKEEKTNVPGQNAGFNPIPVQGSPSEARDKNEEIPTDSESEWTDSSDSSMGGNIENVKKSNNIFNHDFFGSDKEGTSQKSSNPMSPRTETPHSSVISPRPDGMSPQPSSETNKSERTPSSSAQSPLPETTTFEESTVKRNESVMSFPLSRDGIRRILYESIDSLLERDEELAESESATAESTNAALVADPPTEQLDNMETSENNTSKFLDDDPYICVRQRKEQFQKMDVPLAASMNKDPTIQPQYSNNQPIKSASKSSLGSVTSTSRTSSQPAKPVVKPASNFSSIDHRSGLSKSFGAEEDLAQSITSSADFGRVTPIGSMTDLTGSRQFDDISKTKNASKLQSELQRSDPYLAKQSELYKDLTSQNQLNERDCIIKTQKESIKGLQHEVNHLKELQRANWAANRSNESFAEHEDLSQKNLQLTIEVSDLREKVDEMMKKEAEYERQKNEHSKVRELITGINESNMRNLESFEDQLKKRAIAIEKLRGDLDEKRARLDRAENEITLLNETNARLRVEADKVTQQATLEKQIEDLKEENKQIRQNTEMTDKMHDMKHEFQTRLGELEKEKAELAKEVAYTKDVIADKSGRLSHAEAELLEFRRTDPVLRRNNEDQKREIDFLKTQVSSLEAKSASESAKIIRLNEESERLRDNLLASETKLQSQVEQMRSAEVGNTEAEKSLAAERAKVLKLRNDCDNYRTEALNTANEKEEVKNQLGLANDKLKLAETRSRDLEMELRKANQSIDHLKATSDVAMNGNDHKLAVAESKLENANTLNSEMKEETRKLVQEIDQLRRVDVEQTKKIAQLEAQEYLFKRRKDNQSKSSLTLREQEWMREKMQLNDELHKLKLQSNEDRRQLQNLQAREKENASEQAQKIQILEAEVAAKSEDLGRFKRLNEKQYRQLIAQEEKDSHFSKWRK